MGTLAFTSQKTDGTPQTGPITIAPRLAPQLIGAVLVSATDLTVFPDAHGLVSVSLAAGWYSLTTAWDRPIEFTMPDDAATHTLGELVSPGVLVAPFFGANAVAGFAFRQGHLWLTNQTSGTPYAIQLGPPPGFPFEITQNPPDATAAPTAQLNQGILQLRDAAGGWHSVWLGGSAAGPQLRVGDATTLPSQSVRLTATQLQLPNLDVVQAATGAPSYHALLLVGTPAGLSLAFGPLLN